MLRSSPASGNSHAYPQVSIHWFAALVSITQWTAFIRNFQHPHLHSLHLLKPDRHNKVLIGASSNGSWFMNDQLKGWATAAVAGLPLTKQIHHNRVHQRQLCVSSPDLCLLFLALKFKCRFYKGKKKGGRTRVAVSYIYLLLYLIWSYWCCTLLYNWSTWSFSLKVLASTACISVTGGK